MLTWLDENRKFLKHFKETIRRLEAFNHEAEIKQTNSKGHKHFDKEWRKLGKGCEQCYTNNSKSLLDFETSIIYFL